jgi:peroxiredoxin
MALIVVGIVLPWLLLAILSWMGLQLLKQSGRMLLRLESLEARIEDLAKRPVPPAPAPAGEAPAGLELGSPAPAIELPDLERRKRTLAEHRGHRVLLVFFSPRCGFCIQALPQLAEMPTDGRNGVPIPLIVTNGTAEENRRLVKEHRLRCPVLLQNEMEVAAQYKAYGTPMGYLIDEQGRIASEMAIGSEAILALANAPRAAAANRSNGPTGNGKDKRSRGNRPLSTSRLARDGLKKGTPAPPFRLPRVDGGELALEAYRGRKILLVFSDPQCGPCDALAPRLEDVHRGQSYLQIVMISRRDLDANKRKVAALGLTFPVVLQKNWDVSMRYGMFATPIGYLIDENGIIAEDVAVGVEPILELAAKARASLDEGHAEQAGACLETAPP